MHVLTQAEMTFWQENGYVILRDAVPQSNLDAVIDTIWDFMDMDRDDPETWYRPGDGDDGNTPKLKASGMAELYQHQALWDNRQHPRVYGAFADIWETEKLWVSIDRVNLNPPARADWDFQGFVHWDIDTSLRPLPKRVQGVLSLVDVPAEAGGLQVVPGFHRRFDEWVKTQPPDRDPRSPDMTGLELKVPGDDGRRSRHLAQPAAAWHRAQQFNAPAARPIYHHVPGARRRRSHAPRAD